MDEAAELANYLPLSFKTQKEQEYTEAVIGATCLKPQGPTPHPLAAWAPPWRSPSFLDLPAISPVVSGIGC